ncbi:MAG: hypothetical protein AB7E47_03055 [Desulfovibrionaceae bacterium]
MQQPPADERSEAEIIAADLFGVLDAAKAQEGLYVNAGFQNRPLESPGVTITYLFYPKDLLVRTPGMPDSFKKTLKQYNVLATVDGRGGKKLGIFLLCAFNKDFEEVKSVEEMVAGIHTKGLEEYGEVLRQALRADLNDHMAEAPTEGGEQ